MHRVSVLTRHVSGDPLVERCIAPVQVATTVTSEHQPECVLFTGGAGFIGSNVLIHLVQKYPRVVFVCLDNLSQGSNRANLEPIEGADNFVFVLGNITSEATVRSLMMQYNCDTVMHFAAQTHVDHSFVRPVSFTEVNVMGTSVLLKVSKDLGVRRFVHVSTDEVYGDSNDGVVFTESSPLNPQNPYSSSKAAAECLVHGFQASFGDALPIVVVRPNNIYGPRQFPEKLIPKFVLRLARGQTLPLHGRGLTRRSFLFVEDAAEAFDLILHRGVPSQAYNIGAHEKSTRTVKDVGLAVLAAFGVPPEEAERHFELAGDRIKNDTAYDVDSSRIQALGWTPRTLFEDGLRRTVDWYLQHQNHWGNVEQALRPHNSDTSVSTEVGGSSKVWYAPHKFQAYGEEEISEVTQSLRDGWLAPGPRTEEFEKRVADLFGKRYAVMVNSGSSGNMIGLAALGMEPGDEVVTPACTFSTVIAPLEQLRLKPVFVDVEPGRYVPSIEAVLAAISPRTKCIMLPNLIGSKPDWAELRRRVPRHIWLFEDSCDTITHTPESDLSVISFYASHIITAGGLGGCVMFNDEALRNKALMFRDWGRIGNNSEDVSERFAHEVDGIEYDFKFLYGCQGFNMKACEMNAAFGLAQLRKLDTFKAIRKRNISRYVETLRAAGTRYVLPARHDEMDWLALPLMHRDRKAVLRYLEANDVQIRVCFAGNVTRHPAFRHYLQAFPVADRIMAEGFLIGGHHGLTLDDVDRVCKLLIEFDRSGATAEPPVIQNAGLTPERDSVSLDF
mmetsp:Transcript_109543/g.194267  ORF Transcript_109543/g.194267 Transcript_109543/m.194267 type:complete len:784 (+) Transcript_109543:98-2449(+)